MLGWFRTPRTLATGAGAAGPARGLAHQPGARRPEASAEAAPSACPAAVPLASVAVGMRGRRVDSGAGRPSGSTSRCRRAAGRHRRRSRPDPDQGVRPRRRHVVDQGSGIWAGMSGSPVYVDGPAARAVSYGLTSSPSPIGGWLPRTCWTCSASRYGRPEGRQGVNPRRSISLARTRSLARVAHRSG